MHLLFPRLHLFEINDQPWFPQFLREKVQSVLTLLWTIRLPLIQSSSPAQLAAKTLHALLSDSTKEHTFVDFCAGGGGPTPAIENVLNLRLLEQARADRPSDPFSNFTEVFFLLTDLHPHLPAWRLAAAASPRISYVPTAIDASRAPADLLSRAAHPLPTEGTKTFRLFNLAFHHFDDPLAARILADSLASSNGFAIFELQARTLSSLITIFLIGPLLCLLTPLYFWRDPAHLFFTYVVPVIPLVVVFDGYVSSLRTRSAPEVWALLEGEGRRGMAAWEREGWVFLNGNEQHTWPTGHMSWVAAVKRPGKK